LKKSILPILIGVIALAAVVAALIGRPNQSFTPAREMSSIIVADPRLLHQLTDSNPAGQLSDCEAGCRVGSDPTRVAAAIPITGFKPSASIPLELIAIVEPTIPDGCEVKTNPDFVEQVLALVNAERLRLGYRPLQVEPRLTNAAIKHSLDMACRNYFSHQTLEGESPFDRIAAESYPMEYAAENLYAGNLEYNSPEMAFQGWMHSPSHKAAMLNPIYTEVGVGYYYNGATYLGGYFTMDFGTQAVRDRIPDQQ
jgi:uncharacterized protein YkwD